MTSARSLSTGSLFVAVCLCFTIAMGLVVRGYRAPAVSVEHFDEGVYASNLFVGPPEFRYPFQQLYAPPLLPCLFEWLLILTGTRHESLILFNVVMGTLLVFAVAWTANELLRRNEATPRSPPSSSTGFSVGAVAAMWITLTSEILIQYSLTALTDTLLALWLTLAVGAGTRGVRRNDGRWIIITGLFTALAWWTKYNGWLPLAILGAGIVGWGILERRSAGETLSALGKWGVIAAIAFGLWIPCLYGLQETGGYAAVAANHAGYVVGPSGWLGSLQRHLEVDRFYSGWLTASGMIFALWFGAGRFLRQSNGNRGVCSPGRMLILLAVGVALGAAVVYGGLLPVLGLLNGVAFVLAVLERKSHQSEDRNSLGQWILLAWILGLLVATPMYRPYPRLILPLQIGLTIGAGYGIELLLRRLFVRRQGAAPSAPSHRLAFWWNAAGGVAALGMVLSACLFPPVALQQRWEFADIASRIRGVIRRDGADLPRGGRSGVDALVAVYGEPGLFFHLARPENDRFLMVIQPVETTAPLLSPGGGSEIPTYLVTGPHAREAVVELEAHPEQVELVASFDYFPSPLVLLDDVSPAELSGRPPERIQVWTRRR